MFIDVYLTHNELVGISEIRNCFDSLRLSIQRILYRLLQLLDPGHHIHQVLTIGDIHLLCLIIGIPLDIQLVICQVQGLHPLFHGCDNRLGDTHIAAHGKVNLSNGQQLVELIRELGNACRNLLLQRLSIW